MPFLFLEAVLIRTLSFFKTKSMSKGQRIRYLKTSRKFADRRIPKLLPVVEMTSRVVNHISISPKIIKSKCGNFLNSLHLYDFYKK